MSFNLIRNSRVFFTTNVDSTTGAVKASGFLDTNTREIQVLDGFSFSQNTAQETVTLNEAGSTPARGQRSFNTALDPADFSFTTYIRPQDGGDKITAEESVLWNAMFAVDAIGGTAPAWTNDTSNAVCVVTNSNKHQLQQFGLIIVVDATTFVIDNCVLNTATVDFGLDAIASIQWSGNGGVLRQITSPTISGTALSGSVAGTFLAKNTTAPYIANKLSTVSLSSGIGSGGTTYSIPLTGGSLTISNNVTYLTPANLATVNLPVTYFTSTRSITGSLNAYLRTGSTNTAGLMSTLLSNSSTDIDPDYRLAITIGGSSATTKVEFNMPAVMLSIPAVNAEQIVSTTINFTAQGYTSTSFDIASANELTITYTTPNPAP